MLRLKLARADDGTPISVALLDDEGNAAFVADVKDLQDLCEMLTTHEVVVEWTGDDGEEDPDTDPEPEDPRGYN